MSQQPHVEAFLALLGDLNEYVTTTPNLTAPPYVVVHPAMPFKQGELLCGTRAFADNDIQTTCVGATTEQAQLYAELVRDRVQEKRPVIVGFATGLIRNEYTQTAQPDRDVSPIRVYVVDGWSFTTTPA